MDIPLNKDLLAKAKKIIDIIEADTPETTECIKCGKFFMRVSDEANLKITPFKFRSDKIFEEVDRLCVKCAENV